MRAKPRYISPQTDAQAGHHQHHQQEPAVLRPNVKQRAVLTSHWSDPVCQHQ